MKTNGRIKPSNGKRAAPDRAAGRRPRTATRAKDAKPPIAISEPLWIEGDARRITLPDKSVDLIVTSPPYWRKRDYGVAGQIGLEATPEAYAEEMGKALVEWHRLLGDAGSLFLNIGDTYDSRSLAGVPALVEIQARHAGWLLRNRIVWAKETGMPSPARNRLTNRHEFILHFTKSASYYYDLLAYTEHVGATGNPGDVWHVPLQRNLGPHLAPFPDEIVTRAIILGCPSFVCQRCGKPRERQVQQTFELDESRPQARRAMELAREHHLTERHFAAIRSTGVSDAGKALSVQNGTGRNSARVKALAEEAKRALGGYFREFTFGKRVTTGWTDCGCNKGWRPGVVLDPFAGTGTTLQTAIRLGRTAIGVDLVKRPDLERRNA